MTVRVLLFGHYRDALPARADPLSLELPAGSTAADAAAALARQDTRLADLLTRTRIAVRAEFADASTALADGDEIAFLPPMSGG